MKTIYKIFTTLVMLLIVSVCSNAATEQKSDLVHFYDHRWSDPTEPKSKLTIDQVANQLKGYDVIFFGELHNHPAIHLAQMELFARLNRHNPQITLSLEQFERDTQPLLDQYLAREIGENFLAEQARAWDNYRSSYRPLIEFARDRQLPVIAANAPKQMVVCVGRKGLKVLDKYPTDQRKHVAQNIDLSDGPYRQKFFDFMSKDSPHKTPSDKTSQKIMQTMSQRSFAAQMVRDETMAESIAHHLKEHPDRQVLHLNGAFHSSSFLGAVERLQHRRPELKIAVIHPKTIRDKVPADASKPLGTLLIEVLPIPDKFVKPENHSKWLHKMMKKRMESRKNCPD